METFAVYWEPVIKTYGIAVRTGLSLISLDLPFDRLREGEGCLSGLASRCGGSLILIFSGSASTSGICLNLLLDQLPEKVDGLETGDAIGEKVPQAKFLEADSSDFEAGSSGLRVDNRVELVYFQGPHYGDRYGIAGAAVTALVQHGVPLVAVVCTGASVFLITPKGMACAARNALSKAFSTPESAENPTLS
jgi:hypothetical protein